MAPPYLPLDVLLMIADEMIDEDGALCFSDLNSFVQVNRTLYHCLNSLLWQEAVSSPTTAERVLTHVLKTRNLRRLQDFLELGGDVETPLPDFDPHRAVLEEEWFPGPPALLVAAEMDCVPIAELLLEYGATFEYSRSFLPFSALLAAKSPEMVELLLDFGADLQRRDGWRHTPLHFAAQSERLEVVRLMLDLWPLGVRAENRDCATPLHLAAASGSLEVVRLFVDRSPMGLWAGNLKLDTPLHVAARAGRPEVVKLLLERWPEGVSSKNEKWHTPLHLAAASGDIEAVKILVQRWRPGLMARDKAGCTPLHLAASMGSTTEVVRFLVEAWPGSMMAKNLDLETPLHCAVQAGQRDVMGLLLELWPEGLREKTARGNTPLHLAADLQYMDVVVLLAGCWTEGKKATNRDGRTPLEVLMLSTAVWPSLDDSRMDEFYTLLRS
jgi:ankyrin